MQASRPHLQEEPLPELDEGFILKLHAQGLRDLSREHGFEKLRVEGRMPQDLRGTLYFNGPGLFSLYGRPYRHWFDGDGAITAIHFAPAPSGAVRLVESRQLRQERRARRALYTSGLTPAPQWWRRLGLRFKNAANTKPLYWDERLFALFEAGLPTELCPASLSTLGETSLGDAIAGHFSAHYHEVPSRNALYNFGIERGRKTVLHLYELAKGKGCVRRIGSLPLPGGVAMLHDFIATENHLLFFIPPVRIHIAPVLLGLKTPLQAMRWHERQGSLVLVVPIDAPQRYRQFEVAPFFQYHFLNAFEQGSDLVVDFVHVSDFESAYATHSVDNRLKTRSTNGRLYRAVVQARAERLTLEPRWEEACEFPQVAPASQARPYRYGYMLASKAGAPLTRVAKLDLQSGQADEYDFGPTQFPSEAVFVPRKAARQEDEGYLISLVYDSAVDRSFAAVFDSRSLSQGPIARAWFSHHVPKPLHGTWACSTS